jgi:ABC-2 type transport system ATP-binding protein
MPIAELQAVTKHYGAVAALRGIDLAIQPGELLALLGANGAGKTTAVRILLGLTPPTSGGATLFGHAPGSREAKLRRGALLQVAKVPETIRVREHIELFSAYYSRPLPISETIAAAGLQGVEARQFGDLSGGQKQRVLFALAICGNPDILFLDEPTVGLDVEARRTMWKHIRGFVARGGSVLLTTHYLDEADALADRIAVIDRGRIIAEGSPAEVKHLGASSGLEDAFLSLIRQNNSIEEVLQ